MVLQRPQPIPVWGTAAADATISVTLNGTNKTTQADGTGKWNLELPGMMAGGLYTMTIESGSNMTTLSNVYIGDVWLASGQSNMEFTVNQGDSESSVIAAANDLMIRQFKIPKGLSDVVSDVLPGGSAWTPDMSSYVGNFSAVAYFFARDLRKHLDVPIGIINSSYGGSRIETWMSDQMLGYDEQDTTLANGEAEPQPTVAYNKMIHPILQVPIKGVIWYQAESNGDSMEDALGYGKLFKTMINGWRDLWGEGDFPFIWVQLPNYGQVYEQPQSWDAWPQLRAQQSSALTLPNTGEAITIDVGGTSIHPTHKQPVGYQLSLIARHLVYGENIVYSGPRYKNNLLQIDGSVIVNFDHLGSGLMAKDSTSGGLKGFAMAGADGNLVWANAKIDGDHVVVWNDQIPEPKLIRYAWEYNPAGVNLYNQEGLPAEPFKADVNPGFKITTFEATSPTIEQGQSTDLKWQVFGASSVTLDGTPVDSAGTKTISPATTTTYNLIAINREDANDKDTAKVTVEVLDPSQVDRTKGQPTTASTYQSQDNLLPGLATDGDMNTRWIGRGIHRHLILMWMTIRMTNGLWLIWGKASM